MTTALQSRFAFPAARTFAEYHEANPQIYAALRQLALEAKRAGRRIGIKCLWEVLRWQTTVGALQDTFKLDNRFHAGYARLLMESEPELREFFETRRSREDR